MTKEQTERAALFGAGVVIVALTGLAFWLSYAHLAEVAGQHGLITSPARQWAWPATVDSFIVGGELLMLLAALRGHTDRWAIGITAAGSLGSIVFNVAGVPGSRDPGAVPVLDYVVAAVPPTAALLAFGVLMRQVHGLVTHAEVHTEPAEVHTEPADDMGWVQYVAACADEITSTPAHLAPVADLPSADTEPAPLVICGAQQVHTPTVPPRAAEDEVDTGAPERLSTEDAKEAIRKAWEDGMSLAEAGCLSTRSRTYVAKVYAQLAADRGAQPLKGQMALTTPSA